MKLKKLSTKGYGREFEGRITKLEVTAINHMIAWFNATELLPADSLTYLAAIKQAAETMDLGYPFREANPGL